MNDVQRPPAGLPVRDDLPEAVVVSKRRGLSLVWLIPLVAALIGAWLAYKTISEEGPTITITFQDGAGLEAGKTKVMYKAIQIGEVNTVALSPDLSHVIVTAQLHKSMAPHLRDDTQFWVVRPQISLSGVSGLETLLSGVYIEMAPGTGKPQRQFTALAEPPLVEIDSPGRKFQLLAENVGSLQQNSPIYFRGMQVGTVLGTNLAPDFQNVVIPIFIKAPYDQLVHDSSHFWRRSGIDVSLTANGLNLKMDSLAALALGGIVFDTPDLAEERIMPSKAGTTFRLYDDYASIAASSYTQKFIYVMYFDGSVRGLSVGAPVEFRGIQIGVVTEIKLEIDRSNQQVIIPVLVAFEPGRLRTAGATTATTDEAVFRGNIAKLVAKGLRASLQTGNLLTGQLFVDLAFYPDDVDKQQVSDEGEYPVFPTMPSTFDQLQITVKEFLAGLKKLPLDKIGKELAGTLEGTNKLTNAPEWQGLLRSIDVTTRELQKLVRTFDQQIGPLLKSTDDAVAALRGTLGGIDKVLTGLRHSLEIVEPGAPVTVDLSNALEELAAAARSIRVFADYLERNPSALIYGKSGPAGTK